MNTFEELFLRARPELFCYARLLSRGDSEMAEDLVQDCAIRGFAAFETYDHERPFEPWIKRILMQIHLSAARLAQRNPRTVSLEEAEAEGASCDPEAWTSGCFEVLDAISRMRRDYAVVLCSVLEGDAPGDRLARVRRFRAREELRRALGLA